MWNGQTLDYSDYYLWRKIVETRYPWLRQYLNTEFLKYEQKRILKVSEWRKNFFKSNSNNTFGNVSLYTIPIDLSSPWERAISCVGDFNYIGLSALFNSLQEPLIGLIPKVEKVPQAYRLIEISEPKKKYVINKRMNIIEPVLVINDYCYLDSDQIYPDIPTEKNIVEKMLREYLIDDNQIALSFQSPIVSAPQFPGSIGGISLSSISCNSTFARELVNTMQLMVPPEYRTSIPPKKVEEGRKIPYITGAKFHLAERPYLSKNVLSSFYAKHYASLYREQILRNNYHGEFSIISTFKTEKGEMTGIWNELLRNFTMTEITLPWEIDELIESDIYLKPLKNIINEDLWAQVVSLHQHNPYIDINNDGNFRKVMNLINEDIGTIFTDYIKNEEIRNYIKSIMLYQSQFNIKRIAESFARSEIKNSVEFEHLMKARNLTIDNLNGFLNHPRFRSVTFYMKKKRKWNPQYSVVQTYLINNPLAFTSEIYKSLKSSLLFTDINDLQEFLNWLHDKSRVIKSNTGAYQWVG